jgi:hypothetical protein
MKCGVVVHASPDRSVEQAVLKYDLQVLVRAGSNGGSGSVQVGHRRYPDETTAGPCILLGRHVIRAGKNQAQRHHERFVC